MTKPLYKPPPTCRRNPSEVAKWRGNLRWLRRRTKFYDNAIMPPPWVLLEVITDILRPLEPGRMMDARSADYRWHRALISGGMTYVGGCTSLEIVDATRWSRNTVAATREDFSKLVTLWQHDWVKLVSDCCFVFRSSDSAWESEKRILPRGRPWLWFLVNSGRNKTTRWTEPSLSSERITLQRAVRKFAQAATGPYGAPQPSRWPKDVRDSARQVDPSLAPAATRPELPDWRRVQDDLDEVIPTNDTPYCDDEK